MAKVFITYRQVDDAQRLRVRTFAERLRACGIDVVLDQFYLDEHPEGPPDKWPKWSSDQARKTERVIIIGSKEWFLCFDNEQQPGTGLGAACEADDIRTRIYKSANVTEAIRVIVFNDSDTAHISSKLEGWHWMHAERDFDGIVKWLGGTPLANIPNGTMTTTPNNLPRLQPYFGRTTELHELAEALDHQTQTWGMLIEGPGGMGKTSLAVRAAYDCPPGQFQRIIFLSLKVRELDDDGERRITGFILTGLIEMLHELALDLGRPDIAKASVDQRIKLLLEALRSKKILLIFDNLEYLTKDDCDQLITFVTHLPHGCKAILTSRRLIGSGSNLLILEKLDEVAALKVLADLARRNRLLARTNEAERRTLYQKTGGNPLLLRWVVGQLGRGRCRTFAHALQFVSSCPPQNDPLEYIFGDLADEFTTDESRVLAALTHFSLPAKIESIAKTARLKIEPLETATWSLVNRSLVVPDDEEATFALVPMVAEFLRRKRAEVHAETNRETSELIEENGYQTTPKRNARRIRRR